jgi:microcystin-dependent protein
MDWRRSCSLGVMQIEQPDQGTYFMPIAWYWAPDGAKTYYGENAFTSGVWDPNKVQLPFALGEQPPYAFPEYNGENIWGYVGQCVIGTPEQFAVGLTAADLDAIPDPVPACCAPARLGQCWFLRNNLPPKNAGLPTGFVDPAWTNAGAAVVPGTLSDLPGPSLDPATFTIVAPPNPVSRQALTQLMSRPLPAQTIPAGNWSVSIGRSRVTTGGLQPSLQFSISLLDSTGALKAVLKSAFPIGPQPDLLGGRVAYGKGFAMPQVDIDFQDSLCLEFGISAFIFPPHPATWTQTLYDSGNVPIPVPSALANPSPLAELCWPFPQVDPDMPLPGTILPFAGPGVPAGYLLCDGSIHSAAAFPGLFLAIGTTWGMGGAGTFAVPDLRDRTLIGTSPGALSPTRPSARALADVAGEETHQLTVAELAGHDHPVTDPGHAHTLVDPAAVPLGFDPPNGFVQTVAGTDIIQSLIQLSTTGVTVGAAGGDVPHNNVQPCAVVQWIIKF